eukprot:TRINITY_DN1860_c1_g1_i2.p1 TRINITY_DN1860_c1_g1~~TRINITY_DN1860_c1_g1_i2.p1  ORF type:complete len:518 (-),score=87.91 TRINITY_DN1860_c1_g1_i2:589-2142(-)
MAMGLQNASLKGFVNSVAESRQVLLTSSSSASSSRKQTKKQLKVQATAISVEQQHVIEQQVQEENLAANRAQDFSFTLPGVEKSVLGIILGGGAGTRLYPLTKKRAKPAVPLGANYRLIDIPVSNCINSNVTKIYCLTQFNSCSLNRHLSNAYNANIGSYNTRGFVEVLAATQSPENKDWFQGTADAVRQYMWLFEDSQADGVEDFMILSGDQLYRMNYQDFIRVHRESNADITIASLACEEDVASAFGLMKVDNTGQIMEFAEKPKGDALQAMKVDTTTLGLDPQTAAKKPYMASMGIYVIKAKVASELLMNKFPTANDFGSEIIPQAKDLGYKIQAYLYDDYWEDIGTIKAFYNANLALTDPETPNFSFYDKDAPIYTMSRFLPPSKMVDADVTRCVLGDGCVIHPGCKINNSVIGLRAVVNEDCTIENALIMGTDYYEKPDECELVPGCLPMGIGAGSVIRKAIVDKNVRIGPNCQIINKDGVMESNREDEGIVIKDGIVVVVKDAILMPNTII